MEAKHLVNIRGLLFKRVARQWMLRHICHSIVCRAFPKAHKGGCCLPLLVPRLA